MQLSYPKYYKTFSCIAARCEDSCCKEWEVTLDDASVAFYRQLPGALGDRLRQVIRTEDGYNLMTIENGRCPMWRQDGLCQIQAQHGHDALCHTCREFPRLKHEYDGFTEMDLELSCPEASRLIFFADDQMICQGQADGSDDALMEILLSSRKTALDFLKDSPYSLPQKLAIVLLYAHDVQSQIDGGPAASLDPEQSLAEIRQYAPQGSIAPILECYVNLEILTERWKQRLAQPAKEPAWDPLLIRFMTYGIRRYWLQAVSDWDLLCRVKFLISGCLLIRTLGGDTVSTAQLWSKEIENDADNVDALLDAAYTHPGFTDLNLWGLLT